MTYFRNSGSDKPHNFKPEFLAWVLTANIHRNFQIQPPSIKNKQIDYPATSG